MNTYSYVLKPTVPKKPAQPSTVARATTRAAVALPAADTRDVCEVQCVDELKVQRARHAMPGAATVATLADTFKTLGDPTRLRLVAALATDGVEELCVCDLATLLGATQSTVSHSLRALRHLGLVRYRKQGKIAYYRLDDGHVARLLTEGVRHVEARERPRGDAADRTG